MSNSILTPTAVTREVQRVLHANLGFTKKVNRQYDSQFAKSGGKIGDSLKIRLPNQYTVRTGKTLVAQDTSETSVTLQVANQIGVDMNFSSAEMTLELDDFSKRIIEPAVKRLASYIDQQGLSEFTNIYNRVGTAGTTPNTALVYLQAGQKMNEYMAPMDDRCVVINPAAQAATVNALTGVFNPSAAISKQYTKGAMGEALGFDFVMDQNVQTLTCGSRVGTIVIDGTVSTEGSTTIHVDGLTNATDTWAAGDTFTVANVNAVNAEGQDLGTLQIFTVTTAATAASNEVDLTVSPAMYSTGARQTISAFPQDGAAVTPFGTASTGYVQNMAFHKDAFTLATADLEMPSGVDFAAREVMDGVSMRLVRNYDINNDNFPCRLDILYGWKTIRPELACRVSA